MFGKSREPSDLVLWLQDQLAAELEVPREQVNTRLSIARQGADSVIAAGLCHEIAEKYEVDLTSFDLLGGQTLWDVAAMIEAGKPARQASPDPVDSSTGARLSPNQRALWYYEQEHPKSTAYHLRRALRVRGALDVVALGRAMQKLTDRHPALRTRFADHDGEPAQEIATGLVTRVDRIDATTLSTDELKRLVHRDVNRPFDLSAAPLIRASVYECGSEDYLLVLNVHHIVTDLWSVVVLIRELERLYDREANGAPVVSPRGGSSYARFVAWQDERLNGAEGERDRNFWASELKGAPDFVDLPTDQPRSAMQTNAAALHAFPFGCHTTTRLRQFAKDHQCTLHGVLLAAFQVLIHRYTGQHDFVVGATVAGRARSEWRHTVGYFANVLPLRADLSKNPAFSDFLTESRSTALKGMEHQNLPFPTIVEHVNPTRRADTTPLVQVEFAFENVPGLDDDALVRLLFDREGSKAPFAGLELEAVALPEADAQFDLALHVAETHDDILARFKYRAELFDASRITQMASHLVTLLDSIMAHPDMSVLELPILSAQERQALLGQTD